MISSTNNKHRNLPSLKSRRAIKCFMKLLITTALHNISVDAYFISFHSQCRRTGWIGSASSNYQRKKRCYVLTPKFLKRSEWDEEFYSEEEDYDSNQWKGSSSTRSSNKRHMYEDDINRNSRDEEDNDDYDYYDDDDDRDENFGVNEYDYDEYDDDEDVDSFQEPQGQWEWETYQKSTHVYLPPPISVVSKTNNEKDLSSIPQVPKSIIHFIGGTLFGSYPLQFYKQLLERVGVLSNSIIVATSIPVTLTKNPLNHYLLANKIAIDFNKAYRNVIVDEYGEDVASEMKIVGLGHSLGSRLQMIISTSKKLSRIGFERDGNIFIAFNNFNAYSSVPGVKRLESEIQGTLNGGKRRNNNRARDRMKYEYEIGLSDVVNAVSDGIQDRVQSIKTAITPDLDKTNLEFQPSPQQLWDGIHKNYNVNKTLVVQFDQDLIDQSSRLATAIMESEGYKSGINPLLHDGINSSTSVTANNITDIGGAGNATLSSKTRQEDENVGNTNKDIKFARLRGTHLSPVSYSDTFVVQAIKRAGVLGQDKILQEAIQEENEYRSSSKKLRVRKLNQDMGNLSCAIARYITAKITREEQA
mmetsp:Transcript_11579/g.21652  ORF Transcript_11579/g.21652 Transcript_11579/m.21652 type:complete len:585 (+) Transcript_11579:1-1755(+)